MKQLKIIGKALNKRAQQQIKGGGKTLRPVICLAPYLIDFGQTCADGYHMHPQGHCICCKDE
ncbi:hypothetical protein [Tenacibaculum amylolyticum]|uniref:hypothetical protein n=1 Tax=Tenacibaculum amylolyticum TaxID=104269 RepID=UPI0038B645A2